MAAPQKVLLLQGPLCSSGRDYFTSYAMYKGLMSEAQALVPYDASHNLQRLAFFFRRLGYRIVYTGWQADADALQALAGCLDALQLLAPRDVQDPSSFQLIRNNRALMYQAIAGGAALAAERWGEDALCLRMRSDLWLNPLLMERALALLNTPADQHALLVSHVNKADLRSMPDFIFGARASVLDSLFGGLRDRAHAGTSHSSHVHFDIMTELLQRKAQFPALLTGPRALLESFVWRGCPFLPFFADIDPAYLAMDNFVFDTRFAL
jgi:hypothetical protein